MSMGSALMAGANAGQGFIQGQQQAQDNQYKNQMNQLQLQDAQQTMATKARMLAQQQQLSDDAMRIFKPTAPPIPGTQDPNNPTGQGAPGGPDPNQTSAPQDMAGKLSELANNAFARGDLTGGGQALAQATNLRSEQMAQMQKQSAVQAATLKSHIQTLNYVAQAFSGTRDNPQAFQQVQMQLLSDPNIPADERQNIAHFRYSPGMVDMIQSHGQTVAQQKTEQLRQLELQERQRHDQFQEQNESDRTAIEDARQKAAAAKATSNTKVGNVKVPTANDIAAAGEATKQAMGKDVDVNSDDFKAARQNIASRGLALMAMNRGLDASQAFAQAADEAKKAGDIGATTIPEQYKTILGNRVPFTTTPAKTNITYQQHGETPSQPIKLQPGAKDSDLVEGRYYQNAKGQVAQFKGGKFIPVQ